MSDSLRALLAGAIDYAGLFPPASLSLEQAASNHRSYRANSASWLLGRFVCPVGRLADLAKLYHAKTDGPLTVIAAPGDTVEVFLQNFEEALVAIGRFPAAGAVDTLELRWPVALFDESDPRRLANLVQIVAGHVLAYRLGPLSLYFEFPPADAPWTGAERQEALGACVSALADYNRSASAEHCRAGFKLRTGGTTAAAVPGTGHLAAVIHACHSAGVFWKATAGMHHPMRHFDRTLGTQAHGFLNVFAAAALAEVHSLSVERIETILDDEDASHFRFAGDMLTWRDVSASAGQIAATRKRSLRSLGSCSFDEPRDDLHTLGLL